MKIKKASIILIPLIGLILYNRLMVSLFVPCDERITSALYEVPKDADYICFVDFLLPSAEERLFIYDVAKRSFIYSGLTQHGSGKGNTAYHAKFSNDIGSGCSSIGVFKLTSYENMHTVPIKCFRLKGLSYINSLKRKTRNSNPSKYHSIFTPV